MRRTRRAAAGDKVYFLILFFMNRFRHMIYFIRNASFVQHLEPRIGTTHVEQRFIRHDTVNLGPRS